MSPLSMARVSAAASGEIVYPLPIQESVRDMLVDLLDRGVAVDKCPRIELEDGEVGVVGVYVTDDNRLAGVCVTDLGMSCRLGAALSMVPAVAANEAIKRNELPEALLENLREVVNILSRLLNSASTPHLRLADVHLLPGAAVPPEVASLLSRPAGRRDFVVTVEGYGSGRLGLLVAA